MVLKAKVAYNMDDTPSRFHEQLFQDNESSLADKLAKQFKVSDKLYWQAKVMALSDDAKWMDLERFSKSKKPPPIGFEPFVDACLSKKNVTEAERYAERAPIEGKWKLYLKLGNPKKAIDFAFQAKDSNGLIRIMDRHPDDMELKSIVESYLQRLGGELRRVGSITMTTIAKCCMESSV